MALVDGRKSRLFALEGQAEGRFTRSPHDPLQAQRCSGGKDIESGLRVGPECRLFCHEAGGRYGGHVDHGAAAVQDLENLPGLAEVRLQKRTKALRRGCKIHVQDVIAMLQQLPNDCPPGLSAPPGHDDAFCRHSAVCSYRAFLKFSSILDQETTFQNAAM